MKTSYIIYARAFGGGVNTVVVPTEKLAFSTANIFALNPFFENITITKVNEIKGRK